MSQLQYLTTAQYPLWDDFVERSPQGAIYAKSWYLEALNCPFQLLAVMKEDKIVAGIALTKNGRGAYANPYLGKYLGVYYADFDGNKYTQETKRRKATQLLLTALIKLPTFDYFFHPNFTTYLPFYQKNFDNRVRYSYWINLKAQSLAAMEEKFHSKLRSEIRFAQKQNYQLTRDITIADFYKICQQTFLQKGAKFPFTTAFFEHYCQSLMELGVLKLMGIQKESGQLMAAIGLLVTPKVTTLILSGMDKNYIQRGANELLIKEGIQLAKKESEWFDFEGSMIPEIEAFYRKFGGDFRPYMTVYKVSTQQFLLGQLRRWRGG